MREDTSYNPISCDFARTGAKLCHSRGEAHPEGKAPLRALDAIVPTFQNKNNTTKNSATAAKGPFLENVRLVTDASVLYRRPHAPRHMQNSIALSQLLSLAGARRRLVQNNEQTKSDPTKRQQPGAAPGRPLRGALLSAVFVPTSWLTKSEGAVSTLGRVLARKAGRLSLEAIGTNTFSVKVTRL